MVKKSVSIFLTLMFLVFAGLQFNDPDPWVWVPAYCIPALICGWDAFRKVPKPAPLTVLSGSLIWAFFLWPEKFNGVTGPMVPGSGIEEARESLGLMIVALGMLWVLFSGNRKKESGIE